MKRFASCALVLACACGPFGRNKPAPAPAPVAAAVAPRKPLLGITERDVTRRVTPHPGFDTRLVDIYSTLDVTLDVDEIKQRAIAAFPAPVGEDTALTRLRVLAQIATDGTQALAPLAAGYADLLAGRRTAPSLFPTYQAAARFALAALDRSQAYPPLYAALNAGLAPGGNSLDRLQIIFDTTAAVTRRLIGARLDSVIARRRIVIQLYGEIITQGGSRQIHLEGFDTLPPGAPYDPPRFAVAMTPAQVAEVSQYADVARQIGTGAYANALSGLAAQSRTTITRILGAVNDCATSVVNAATAIPAPPQAFVDARTIVQELAASISALHAKYQAPAVAPADAATLLSGAATDVDELLRRAGQIKPALEGLAGAAGRLPASASPAAAQLAAGADRCVKSIDAEIKPIQEFVSTVRAVLGPSRVAGPLNELSVSALRLNANELPAVTTIALRTDVGERAAGDDIVLYVRTGEGDASAQALRILETRRFVIGRAVTYFQTRVGLIFARPFEPVELTTPPDSPFYPAAAYSVLLKPLMGSWVRKHGWYEQVLDPGLGINMSALDFDHDNNPELGVSFVASVLRDYLQGGVGWNIQANRGFYFIGIRLPAPGQALAVPRQD